MRITGTPQPFEKAENQHVFRPPAEHEPLDWELRDGRWAWLPEVTPWVTVLDQLVLGDAAVEALAPYLDLSWLRFRFAVPQLPKPAVQKARQRASGRRRLRDTEPAVLPHLVAHLDLFGSSVRGAAREETLTRQAVQHRLKEGRAMLADEGALPWAAWPNGVLPVGWWRGGRFFDAIYLWYSSPVASRARMAKVEEAVAVKLRRQRPFGPLR